MKRFLLLIAFATTANAQLIATAGTSVVVAHDGRVELFDSTLKRVWSTEGLEHPTRIIAGRDRVAILDSFDNEVRLFELGSGRGERAPTSETPVDAAFIDRDLYVLDRDASRVERVGGSKVTVAQDPAFIRAANQMLFVYSRLDGVIQEIDPKAMRIIRTVTLSPFASDFEIAGGTGYLVYPHDAKLRTFALATLKRTGDIGAGVVPVDLAVTARANAVSASRLALADPSAKRVWIVEGEQSIASAISRGFLRGLLGLGLFSASVLDFPTGVDRVLSRGSITVAYDTTTRTLYRMKGSKGTIVARDIEPGAFAVTENAVAIWQNGAVRLIH